MVGWGCQWEVEWVGGVANGIQRNLEGFTILCRWTAGMNELNEDQILLC